MSRETRLYLDDMLEACRRVISYTTGMSFEHFVADQRTRDAVARNLEILGEAAKKVPEDVRKQLPAISWREVCAFRDVLAHNYFGIDERIVWDVVTLRAPSIMRELQPFLAT
ncbi:MAG TPA: DUF86 domain-containing protein [Myxococcales bacterium]|jgi:uncharacterized protein with HEPN domain